MSLSKLPRDFVSTACYPRAMAYNSADLKMADDHIALGERHVIRQRELLAFLKSHGHPIDVAEDLLAEFEATLVQHRLHRAQMLEHPRMRFGEQGNVERGSLLPYMIEADLIRQDGLSRSRRALDDVHATLEQAAWQNFIEFADISSDKFQPHQ